MDNPGELLRRWHNMQDESAFKALYEGFYHMLLGFATRFVNHETARDIVQDTFLKIWTDPSKYAVVKDLRFYMLRSVQNSCLNYVRSKKVEEKFRGSAEVATDDAIHQAVLEEEIFLQIGKAIGDLPAIYRDVMILSVEGLSDKEVSARLSISVDNVKTRKKRAKVILRDTLKHPMALLILNLL